MNMRLLIIVLMFLIPVYAQSDLSSTSAGDSIPTSTSKSEALQANANPFVARHARDIAKSKLTPNEFLDKFSVWRKAGEVKGAVPTDVFNSVIMSPGVGGAIPVANSDPVDTEVESFLIAYKISSELKLKFKDVIDARKNASSLGDALKFVARKERKANLIPQLDSLVSETAVQFR